MRERMVAMLFFMVDSFVNALSRDGKGDQNLHVLVEIVERDTEGDDGGRAAQRDEDEERDILGRRDAIFAAQ